MAAKVVVKLVVVQGGVSLATAVSNALQEAITETPGLGVSKVELIPKADYSWMLMVGFDFAGGGGSAPSVPGSNVGPYICTAAYVIGDIVNYNGILYTCIQNGTGQQPDTSPLYWEMFANSTTVVMNRAPLVTDDSYAVGTIWVYEGDSSYICAEVLPGAATWLVLGGSFTSINGGAFITDIVPQGAGNVGNKVYSSNNHVLVSCTTDTDLITVSVMAITGNTNYIPVVAVNGSAVTLSDELDAPIFRGTVNIDLAGSGVLTITHEDGAVDTVTVAHELPPEVLAANFVNGYPGTQTELKENDTYDFHIVTDVDIVRVEFENYGAYKAQTFDIAAATIVNIPDVIIADRGLAATSVGAKVRVQKATGSWSDWHLTENDGVIDGVNKVVLNNIYPVITFGTITYPGGQAALKDAESATVAHTIANQSSVLYASPNGELTITNTSTYETNKNVVRLAGTYNVSVTNFRVTAARAANAATTVGNTVVYIAHVVSTVNITIDGSPARLRSGGSDGSVAQEYTVRITSSQNLLSAPTLTVPAGVWLGAGFAGSGTVWTRVLQVRDSDLKGGYSFAGLSATNIAGLLQTVINSGAAYTLGGFVARQITLLPFQNESSTAVEAVDYNKVIAGWTVTALTSREAPNSSPHVSNGWCLVAYGYGVTPITVRILDDVYTSISEASTVTLEELV
jgi:hypothetical protein